MGRIGERLRIKKQYFMKYKLGMLFGSWDILHAGHIRLFKRAKDLCEEIVVCVDTDELIKKVKCKEPFSPLANRIEDLWGIRYIDKIDIEGDKKDLIKRHRPDVLIKGDDWKGKKWSGEGLGVKVLYLPHTKNIHSTDLRNGLGISKHKTIR
jgi:glycerol-3-phosphate cytidylyltransferase